MKNSNYDELFDKMRKDGYYGSVLFKLVDGEVKLIRFESTFKSVGDAIAGKTAGE
jgi:hypothetical protein